MSPVMKKANMPTVGLPQELPLSGTRGVKESLKPAHKACEVLIDKTQKHTFDSSYTVALQAVTTDPAQPDEAHLLAAIGNFSKTEKEPKLTGPDFMEVDKTPRQEDISRRSTWLCDSIVALDTHIKNQPINSINPHDFLYNGNPHTDISASFAAYRRLSLPPGFTLGRGAPFEFKLNSKTVMADNSELDLPREVDGIEVNPEWGLTKAGKARQRLPIACTNCRGKKIKCLVNKDGGPCHNCLKSESLKATCRTEGR
ncbi:hypothetical protein AA313_de0206519 [Arthrobotrys entomopaga]|nr:hypothetical protein AA313_de0206519 [Arthrobotrys entomopaga]